MFHRESFQTVLYPRMSFIHLISAFSAHFFINAVHPWHTLHDWA